MREGKSESSEKETSRHMLPLRSACLVSTILCTFILIILISKSDDQCILEAPRLMDDLFRPVADCRACINLFEINRMKNVDAHFFMNNFAYAGVPSVVEDCATNWTALSKFDVQFFFNLYSQKPNSDCQFFKYKTSFKSLQQALDNINNDVENTWYIGWSNCDTEIADILRDYYSRPYFLPEVSESTSTDWIFMGSAGHGAPKHVDNVRYPSWQTQIKGRKKWILYTPPECFYICTKHKFEIVLNQGDTIVVDTNLWYHETYVIGDEISISIGSEFD